MCSANATALHLAIEEDFKKEFGIDLNDEDMTEVEDGYEVDYRDYDLNNFGKYHHSPLIERCDLENDGRSEYLRVYGYLTYEDYFGV